MRKTSGILLNTAIWGRYGNKQRNVQAAGNRVHSARLQSNHFSPSQSDTSPLYTLGLWCGCVLLVAFLQGCNKTTTHEEITPPPPLAKEVEIEAPRPVITQEQYDKILYDTPYADVVDYLGMDPSRQESTYDEGVEGYTRPSVISWYIWENPDGSFLRLGFTEKRLTDKQSHELPGSQ